MGHRKIAVSFMVGTLLFTSQTDAEVPGPAQIGAGAGDLVRLCTSPRNKTPDAIISGCTRVIQSTAFHGEAWPYLLRAIAYEQSGKLDLAIADMDQAIDLAPKTNERTFLPVYYHDRCIFRLKAGKLKDALDDCSRSLKLRPDDVGTLEHRARIEYMIGDYTAAITDCGTGLFKDEKNASLMYIRGLARIKSGDETGGATDLAAAKMIDPKIGDIDTDSNKTP